MVLIMTSNVGARDLAQARLGFGERGNRGDDDRAYKNLFSPEFRNRLDARIMFKPLDPAVMSSIVEKFVKELAALLADRQVTLDVTAAAKAWLGVKGYDPRTARGSWRASSIRGSAASATSSSSARWSTAAWSPWTPRTAS